MRCCILSLLAVIACWYVTPGDSIIKDAHMFLSGYQLHFYTYDLLSFATYDHYCAFRTASAVGAVDLKGYTLMPRQATDEQRASISVVVFDRKGNSKRSYCRPDGAFTVHGLEEGEYMLEVAVIGWTFPPYNVKVSAQYHDGVRVTPLDSRVPLEPVVILAPLSEAQYFAKRKPIDFRSYLFSPYGLMMVFGLFIILVAPNMKVDPEEVAKMQEEMKDSPLSFMFGGQPQQVTSSTSGSAVTAAPTPAPATATTSTGTSKRSGKRR